MTQALSFAPAVKVRQQYPPNWKYEARLLARVECMGADAREACWIWQGPVMPNGYGQTNAWGKVWLTHRLAYTLINGPIPAGLQIDHLCRVRACINPAHLEAVTQRENLRRQGRAVTHCPRGHKYDSENTYQAPGKNERRCRTCTTEKHLADRDAHNARRRARRAAGRAAA